jgi:hypothetical protein
MDCYSSSQCLYIEREEEDNGRREGGGSNEAEVLGLNGK